MSTARRIYCSTIACVLLALAMTSAAAASVPQQDGGGTASVLRSPDARDAAAGRGTFNGPDAGGGARDLQHGLDQRGARDVSSPQVFTDAQRAIVGRFKRSPSYQEALREAMTVVKLPQPAPVRSDDGIDWGDAGIGAGTLLGVIALALAGTITVLQRRRRGHRTAIAA